MRATSFSATCSIPRSSVFADPLNSAIHGRIKPCVQLFPSLSGLAHVITATWHDDFIQLITGNPLGLRWLLAEGTALGAWR
jgi:hypothetical protein